MKPNDGRKLPIDENVQSPDLNTHTSMYFLHRTAASGVQETLLCILVDGLEYLGRIEIGRTESRLIEICRIEKGRIELARI